MSHPSQRIQLINLHNIELMVEAIRLDLPKAHQAFATFAPDGHSHGQSDGRGSIGDHSDPTGNSIAQFDEVDERMTDVDMAIVGALRTLRVAWEDITGIAAMTTEKAHEIPPGQGWCRAHCGHWCPGTDADRLRSGLCNGCDSWSRRNGRPDIAVIQGARRGNEGNCQCDDCKRPAMAS